MANSNRLERIATDPDYIALVGRRGRFTLTLTVTMLVIYFGFILIIAFNKSALAVPIGSGVTSIGILVGLGVILFAIGLTGLYVRRANRDYDALIERLTRDHGA